MNKESTEKKGRGGSRPGSGAKKKPDELKRVRHTVFATPEEWKSLGPSISDILHKLRAKP